MDQDRLHRFVESLEEFDTVEEIASSFELDLRTVVIVNHELTIEAIDRLEERRIDEIRDALGDEDADVVESAVGSEMTFHDELRSAARHLAVVGLVTRFEHWIYILVQQAGVKVEKGNNEPILISRLNGLNEQLKFTGSIPIKFFSELVDVRDSIIHGDAKATFGRSGRTVAAHYTNRCGGVDVTEDQLKEAFENAIKQVDTYKARIDSPIIP